MHNLNIVTPLIVFNDYSSVFELKVIDTSTSRIALASAKSSNNTASAAD